MCVEIATAYVGGPYGRRSIEELEAAGYKAVSGVDPRYGSVRMGRQCPDCICTSPEECLTLGQLGLNLMGSEGSSTQQAGGLA